MTFKDSLCFNVTDEDKILAEVILLPMSSKMFLKLGTKLTHAVVGRYLGPRDNFIYMHRMWVRAVCRGKGLARIVMQSALRWADNNEKHLVLRCIPFDNQHMNKQRLEAFYRRYRFHALKGHPGVRLRVHQFKGEYIP